ncbi:MAG: hypothetical protein AAGB34_10265, partial [Planctomycetota bacterium]
RHEHRKVEERAARYGGACDWNDEGIMKRSMITGLFVAVLASPAFAATAQIGFGLGRITEFTWFSLANNNGSVSVFAENDAFNSQTFGSAGTFIRTAHAEFNIGDLNIGTVTSATLVGGVRPRQGGANTQVGLFAYSGNGATDTSDATIAASQFATIGDPGGVTGGVGFDLDVTSVIQGLVDSGATHFGLRAEALADSRLYLLDTNGNTIGGQEFPPLVLTIDFEPVPTPGTVGLLATAGLVSIRRRRRV